MSVPFRNRNTKQAATITFRAAPTRSAVVLAAVSCLRICRAVPRPRLSVRTSLTACGNTRQRIRSHAVAVDCSTIFDRTACRAIRVASPTLKHPTDDRTPLYGSNSRVRAPSQLAMMRRVWNPKTGEWLVNEKLD